MLTKKEECGTNLKFRFATDSRINGGSRSNSFGNKAEIHKNLKSNFRSFLLISRVKHFCPSLSQINGVQKSFFLGNFKKRPIQKRIARFSLQFLKSKRLCLDLSLHVRLLAIICCFSMFSIIVFI